MFAGIFPFVFALSVLLSSAQNSLADQLVLPEKHIHSDAVDSALADNMFVGNIESMKYHRADCEFARLMRRRKRIRFHDDSAAAFAGMKPCNWCLPRWSTRVEGRLVNTKESALNAASPGLLPGQAIFADKPCSSNSETATSSSDADGASLPEGYVHP